MLSLVRYHAIHPSMVRYSREGWVVLVDWLMDQLGSRLDGSGDLLPLYAFVEVGEDGICCIPS